MSEETLDQYYERNKGKKPNLTPITDRLGYEETREANEILKNIIEKYEDKDKDKK